MNRKWLGAVVPLTMLLASCADLPTGAAPDAPSPSGRNLYVAPAGDVVIYGTGHDTDGGQIWAVNLTQGTTHSMWDGIDPNTGDANSPNAVAFDAVNGRLYFTVNSSTNSPFPGTPDALYMFNVTPPYAAPVNVGTIVRTAYSADFWQGSYYYIPNRTHNLRKVDLDPAGFKTGESVVCPNFRSLIGGDNELFFGDIAIRNGVVYGSVADGLLGAGPRKFFRLTLAGCGYEEFLADDQLQLAWGGDGILYGHATATGLFHVVNPNNGTLTPGPTYAPNVQNVHLSDIAPAGFQPPPPPPFGTCEGGVTKVVVKYVGTTPLGGEVRGQRRNPATSAILPAIVSGAGPNTLYTFAIESMGGQFDAVANGRLANNFKIFIGNQEIVDFHTSCSAPIYPGMLLGPATHRFEITEVWSAKGGQIGPP